MGQEQSGVDFLLYVKTADGPPEVFSVVGGQRDATLKLTNDAVDASHKTSGAWKVRLPGLKDWGITGSAVIMDTDAGADALEAAYFASEKVKVRLNTPGDAFTYTGMATIADLTKQTPHDGPATFSIDLQGAGPLTKAEGS